MAQFLSPDLGQLPSMFYVTRWLNIIWVRRLFLMFCTASTPTWSLCFGYLLLCNKLAKLSDLAVHCAHRFFRLGTQKGTVGILISSLWHLRPQLGRLKWFSGIIRKLLLPGAWAGLTWRLGSAGTVTWGIYTLASLFAWTSYSTKAGVQEGGRHSKRPRRKMNGLYDLASEATKHHHYSIDQIVTSPCGFKERRYRPSRWMEYQRIFSWFFFYTTTQIHSSLW